MSNVVDSGVIGPNLNEFLHNVDKSLSFSLMKLELWPPICYRKVAWAGTA